MNANIVKWTNQFYNIIRQSLSFWVGICTKGVIHTLASFYLEEGESMPVRKSKYNTVLSSIWLLLLINLLLSSSIYLKINHPLLNLLSYISLLVFIVITVFISWLSFIHMHLEVDDELKSITLAFHSEVRFWSTSLSFALFIIIAMILGYSNLIILICLLPGLYFQLNKLLMSRHIDLIEETKLILNR